MDSVQGRNVFYFLWQKERKRIEGQNTETLCVHTASWYCLHSFVEREQTFLHTGSLKLASSVNGDKKPGW